MAKEKVGRTNFSVRQTRLYSWLCAIKVARSIRRFEGWEIETVGLFYFWEIVYDITQADIFSFKDYLQNLPLTDLLQKFPTFVDEKFLRNKNYCVYVDTLYAWPELKDKNLSEIEDIVRKHSGDNSKIQYEYVGKHSNGLCSRPGHKWDPKSAIYKFLKKNQNGRAFNSWIFDCNPLGMKTATGDRLRKMIARAECQMNAVEAFLIVSVIFIS